MRKLVELYARNWKIVLLTFEVFWVVVFLLEAAGRTTGAEITPFVYVNF